MKENVQYNCVVVIPVYRIPTLMEQCSFKQGLTILKNYDIVIVTNKNVDLTKFEDISTQCGKSYGIELFDEKFFKGVKGYNALCLSKDFYKRFSDNYVYMLIYQLDAWVFRDELQEWCDKGYDYIGSPFFVSPDEGEHYIEVFNGVGNGGLSLRRLKYCLGILNKPKYLPFLTVKKIIEQKRIDIKYRKHSLINKYLSLLRIIPKAIGINNYLHFYINHINEDYIFSDFAAGSYFANPKLPTPEEASFFCFEVNPSFLYKMNGNHLPFGCHAFEKYEYDVFWYNYIPHVRFKKKLYKKCQYEGN